MKVLVFIEHNIVFRHFVMSGALTQLAKASELVFVFPEEGGKRFTLDPEELDLPGRFERLPIDDSRQVTWRWLLFADQLRWRMGSHECAIRKMRRRTLGLKASFLLTMATFPILNIFFKNMVEKRLHDSPPRSLRHLIETETPDVVLHPTVLDSVFLNDLVIVCEEQSIPLVAAMNSWDNPSTKRAVVGKPDKLLVWGPQTSEHAKRFMKLSQDSIVEFGAAQFDIFRELPRTSRANLCEAYNIDPADHVVMFAGSNAQTDEVGTLDQLDEAIGSGTLTGVSIIYRPHPWGGGGRNGHLIASRQWRHIKIDNQMTEYVESLVKEDRRITLPSYQDTHDLLECVDSVISPLSTILLEALLHGKQAIPFLPLEQKSAVLAGNLPFLHFEEFLTLPEIRSAFNFSELLSVLSKPVMIDDREATSNDFRQSAEWFVKPFNSPWRSRIVDFLEDLVDSESKTR